MEERSELKSLRPVHFAAPQSSRPENSYRRPTAHLSKSQVNRGYSRKIRHELLRLGIVPHQLALRSSLNRKELLAVSARYRTEHIALARGQLDWFRLRLRRNPLFSRIAQRVTCVETSIRTQRQSNFRPGSSCRSTVPADCSHRATRGASRSRPRLPPTGIGPAEFMSSTVNRKTFPSGDQRIHEAGPAKVTSRRYSLPSGLARNSSLPCA